jgi:hypothetical protein
LSKCRILRNLRRILPLPAREGRGEGERRFDFEKTTRSGPREDVLFPLTLTLSLGEREQPAAAPWISAVLVANSVKRRSMNSDANLVVSRRMTLPLPKGEGRGEGECIGTVGL